MSINERMSLEQRWKLQIQMLQSRGEQDTLSWINIGSRIVEMYNNGNEIDKIRYVRLVSV